MTTDFRFVHFAFPDPHTAFAVTLSGSPTAQRDKRAEPTPSTFIGEVIGCIRWGYRSTHHDGWDRVVKGDR